MAGSAVDMRSQMQVYVQTYENLLNQAQANYNQKSALANDPHNRQALADLKQAEAELTRAQNDFIAAQTYADNQIALAEKEEAKQAKQNGKSGMKEAASGAGLSVATVGAGAATVAAVGAGIAVGVPVVAGVKYVKGVKHVGEVSRLAMNKTASQISMQFAKILGVDRGEFTQDPTRKTWDPMVKWEKEQAKKGGRPERPENQLSFI